MSKQPLPAPFADLERFADAWALPSERDRYVKLHSVSLDELRVFYDAVLPRVDEIAAHLNQYERGALPEDARNLYFLALTFAEVSHPCDLRWKDVDFEDACPWQRFEFGTVSLAPTD